MNTYPTSTGYDNIMNCKNVTKRKSNNVNEIVEACSRTRQLYDIGKRMQNENEKHIHIDEAIGDDNKTEKETLMSVNEHEKHIDENVHVLIESENGKNLSENDESDKKI